MKKILKKLSYALLVMIMVLGIMSVTANAETGIKYDKNVAVYMTGKDYLDSWKSVTIYIDGVPKNQSISKSSVKIISGKNVVSLSDIWRSTENYSIEYFEKGKKARKDISRYDSISLTAKKTGNAKISFKVAGKTYTSKIKILPYVNPISSLTITGVQNGSSKNLAGKFKKSNEANVQVKKGQKNASITCKAAAGWKITSLTFSNKTTSIGKRIVSEKGVSSVKLRAGNLVAGQKGYITITLLNTETGGTQSCDLDFGSQDFF